MNNNSYNAFLTLYSYCPLRIYRKEWCHYCAILSRHHAWEAMLSALSTCIEVSVGKLGKATTDGKAKFPSVELITTLEHLTQNGMLQQFMVSVVAILCALDRILFHPLIQIKII